MIHTCNQREWYVQEFLLPSFVKQGIKKEQITVWHDYKKLGNLASFLGSLGWIRENWGQQGGTWHLQDDVCISKNFKRTTEENDQGIVAGFVNKIFDKAQVNFYGRQPASKLWFSFQCIRIPNNYAGEFLDWIYKEAIFKEKTSKWYKTGKMDDSLFKEFIQQKHFREYITNLNPNIVNHIDYLIGGSQINKDRGEEKRDAFYWGQTDTLFMLEEGLAQREFKRAPAIKEHFNGVQEEFTKL